MLGTFGSLPPQCNEPGRERLHPESGHTDPLAARRKAKLTQVELAARLGKPQSVISAIEAGMRRVDLVEFLAVVRALNADPVEIFVEIAGLLP